VKLNILKKQLATAGALLVLTTLVGVVGIINLASVDTLGHSMYVDRAVPIGQLGEVETDIADVQRLSLRGIIDAGVADVQAKVDADIAADQAIIKESIDAYAATYLLDSEKAGLADFETNYADYQQRLEATRVLARAGSVEEAMAANLLAVDSYVKAKAAAKTLKAINLDEAKRLSDEITSTYESSRMVSIALILAAIAIGFGVSFWMARGFTRGAQDVQRTITSLTDKCATWLQEGLERLADNDLTYEVTPVTPPIERFSGDEIGETARYTNKLRDKLVATIQAYNEARASLTSTITEVKEASDSVARTSVQLSEAATQTGAATQQIATTIQQVAAGASDQARAATETSGAVNELSGVIGQVGNGAAETTRKVDQASATISQMTEAIKAASAASDEVRDVSGTAATAADNGATAVRQTVAGMAKIKTAVDASAVKVTELGAKGEQIGAIVETINDIAEQTNLLALNAAIEAARAGEQGKGFAVVADEVRKLAERSGRATKEIAALIAEVQAGTEEAVAAMRVGATEVETGSELAAKSGAALDEIAGAVNATRAAVGRITTAVDAMSAASGGVVKAIDEIAGIAEGNNANAATMTANAGSVSRSVESIAAISEENSAAAEEVSAATEEMSAQSEEVVASVQSLSSMAARLDELVAQFTLADSAGGSTADKVVQRRRAADWKAA